MTAGECPEVGDQRAGPLGREIVSNLRGRFSQSATDLTLQGIDLDRLVPNFMRATLRMLESAGNTSSKEKKSIVECEVAHFVFGDGLMVADRSIQLRTEESIFVVTWMLDLTNEQQRIQVIPKVRRGISLGASDLARTLQVTGSLLDPKLEVDPAGLFLLGAESVALYATGGWVLYLGWRQVEANLSKPDACERNTHYYLFTPTAKLKLPVREGTLPQRTP